MAARAGASPRRYAEAVFDLAREEDALDRWRGDLQVIAAFAAEPGVARVLANARVPREAKERLVTAGLGGRIVPQAMNLVRLLEQRGRMLDAPAVLERYQELLDEHRGVAHARVTTAVALSDDERRAVAAKLSELTDKQVDVTSVVDESIIGGVIARIGDQLIDGSTRSRLIALRRRLEGVAR